MPKTTSKARTKSVKAYPTILLTEPTRYPQDVMFAKAYDRQQSNVGSWTWTLLRSMAECETARNLIRDGGRP